MTRLRIAGRTFFALAMHMFLLLTCSFSSAEPMEAKWTPTDEKDGPLPLSMNQRQQLLQLEQAILSSPNPDATLEQVAAQNDMAPNDLYDMLQRNHADMAAAGAAGDGSSSSSGATRTNVAWQAVTGITGVAWHAASKHPKAASLFTVSLVGALYIGLVAVPRTGLVLSSRPRRALWLLPTAGPTTAWYPPARYVQRQLEQLVAALGAAAADDDDEHHRTVEMLALLREQLEGLLMEEELEDGVTWHNVKSIKSVKQALTAQATIEASELGSKIDDDDEAIQDILNLSFDHAARILRSRDVTEFAGGGEKSKLKLITAVESDRAILVVPGMGDWGRYGLLPLHVLQQQGEDDDLQLTLTVLKGGHWDGQIHISILQLDAIDDDNTPTIAVRVSIVVPRHGKAPSRAVAAAMAHGLAQSMAASIRTRTQQTLARSAQSHNYHSAAHGRARDRRSNRSALERQMEDMAVERRRRWQRKNPSGVSNYRPSGERMRSPNNAVY